jgi:flagellar basal-body rod protein FlgG
MWTARTAMNAQQDKLNIISNNISNMDTDGYKSQDVGFSDLVYETLNRKGIPVTNNSSRTVDPQNGTGVKNSEVTTNTASGSLLQTGLKTDLGLQGDGYFKVIRPDGSNAYVRSGDFTQDASGRLVDSNGDRLEVIGQDNFTNGNFTVDTQGNISVGGKNVGKINVYDTIGQDSLVSVGNNLYVPKNGATMFATNGATINQGYSEGSNVDLSQQMTDMIEAQRSFQLSSKVLTTADDMASMVNQLYKGN